MDRGGGKGIEGIEFLQINRVNAPSDIVIGEGRVPTRLEPTTPLPRYIPLLRYPVIPNNPLRDGSRSFEKVHHRSNTLCPPLRPFSMEILVTRWRKDFLLFVLLSLRITPVHLLGRETNFVIYIYKYFTRVQETMLT